MSWISNANICLFRGDDLRVIARVVDQAGEEMDIQDVTSIRWWAAKSASAPPLIQKSLGDGISLGGPNVFFFDLAPVDTEELTPGTFYHEAEVITAQGRTYTILSGRLTIQRDLVRG